MAKRRTEEQKYEAYGLLANAAISLHEGSKNCPKQRAFNIRQVCNGLYDTPSTHTGLVSEEGQHLRKSDLVEEHFFPRTPSAHKMFEMLDAGATREDLIEYIKMVCQVHLVTKDENSRLRPFQKLGSGYDTWEEQYAAAKIKLVPYVRKKRRRDLKIYVQLTETVVSLDNE
jgi:hypothetical protein